MMRRVLRCSFCRRPDSEVQKLVAGPFRLFAGRVYICDRCATRTIEIMDAHAGGEPPQSETGSLLRRTLHRLGWSHHRDARGRSERHAT